MIMMGCMAIKDTSEMTQQQLVITAFNASKAEVLKSTLVCKGLINETLWEGNKPTLEQIEALGNKLISNLEAKYIPIERKSNISDTVIKHIIRVQTAENRYVKLTLWHEALYNKEAGQTYMQYELTQDLSYQDIHMGTERLEKGLMPYVDYISTTTTIIGTYKGKLTAAEVYQMSEAILHESQAEGVEHAQRGDSVTVFGYTPHYKQYSKINNQKANLSISVHYNELEGRTYITLQSIPVTRELSFHLDLMDRFAERKR